jgi:eukaryotic-like serine/threonine-protein kinase
MRLSIPQITLMSRLLDEALPLDFAARREWLETLSPEYHDLASALREALLPGDADSARLKELEDLPRLAVASEMPGSEGAALQAGVRVGPYELIRLLGAGGMAQVWLARRADGAFRREVALKLPRFLALRADLESRFSRERDILASLEHPLIARFYDAGVDPSGLQYLAMEYVRGEPLTTWCDAHQLGIAARLPLFMQVLEAVQYAHEKHVIHRDLKPSNVLVTETGEVRLLDFGVAKLLAPDTAQDTQLTGAYGRALTPDYASPELLRGDALDPRSDVYSLGVMLFELLTGARPYQLKSAASLGSLHEGFAALGVRKASQRIEQAALAGRAATSEQLARQLRGDLDAIVMRAIAPEPSERYTSVAALADDLRRHLDGQPIRARPARLAYRLRKFMVRNRVTVAVAATAVAAIVGLLGYTAYRETAHRREATAAEPAARGDLATTSASMGGGARTLQAPSSHSVAVLPFVDMSEKHDQEYFADGLAEELIDHLAHSSDLRVIARTSSFQFKAKNEDIRSIAGKLGVANLLEGSVRKSGERMRITAQLIRASDGSHLWSQTYDQSVSDIFKVQDDIAGMVTQALSAALSVGARGTAGGRPQNIDAYNLLLKGNFLFERYQPGDLAQAIEQYKLALELDPDYVLAWTKLARAYINQGYTHELAPEEGEAKTLAALRRALTLDPNSAAAHRWLGRTYHAYDWDWTGAQRELERAVALDPTGEDGRLARTDLAYIKAQMSGDLADTIALAREDLARNPLDANTLGFLASMQQFAGQLAEATVTLRRMSQLNPTYNYAQTESVLLLLLTHRPSEAVAAADKLTDAESRLSLLAMAYWSLGRKADSDAALRQLESRFGASDPSTIAAVRAHRGERSAAIDWLERAYRQRDPELVLIKVDPSFASLRDEPRYKAILRKMKLPDTAATGVGPRPPPESERSS